MNNIANTIGVIAGVITSLTIIISAVIKVIDKTIFKPMFKRLDKLDKKIDNNRKDDLRYKILSFASDLRNGIGKTRQEYETIFMFYDKYELLIKTLEETNGYLETEMEYIKRQYNSLMNK